MPILVSEPVLIESIFTVLSRFHSLPVARQVLVIHERSDRKTDHFSRGKTQHVEHLLVHESCLVILVHRPDTFVSSFYETSEFLLAALQLLLSKFSRGYVIENRNECFIVQSVNRQVEPFFH